MPSSAKARCLRRRGSGPVAPAIQRAPAAATAAPAPASSEVVAISSNVFSPSQRAKDEIEAQGSKGLDVRVIVKGLTAEGCREDPGGQQQEL